MSIFIETPKKEKICIEGKAYTSLIYSSDEFYLNTPIFEWQRLFMYICALKMIIIEK